LRGGAAAGIVNFLYTGIPKVIVATGAKKVEILGQKSEGRGISVTSEGSCLEEVSRVSAARNPASDCAKAVLHCFASGSACHISAINIS
jgi:hypothetical protein